MTIGRVARPSVLRQVPLDRHVLIEASAGTGKTFTLEHLVVELLLSTDVGLEQLLIVTFTEKATHELRSRVRAKLEALQSGRGDPPSPEQVAAGDFWTLDAGARKKLERSLRAFDGATITTIHAFCQRVLRENAFASGRLFEERQVDARDAFGRALRDALRRDVARDPERARWLEAALGAGWSIARVEDLLWRCTTIHGEIRPTIDLDALGSALLRFPIADAQRSDLADELKKWGTHPSRAKSIARRLNELAGVVEPCRSANDTAHYVVRAKGVELPELVEKLELLAPRPGPVARLCDAARSLADLTPPFPAALAHAVLPVVQAELARAKRDAGRYDFDDMLSLVDEALSGPQGASISDSMRRRFRHAFVDEFQDTDEMQWSIFRRAFFDVRGAEPPSPVVLVGDPKQSIYRFRGADVETYLRARERVVASGGIRVALDQNFRATPELVQATNVLFDPDAPEPLFTGAIRYSPVDSGRPDRRLVDADDCAVSPLRVLRFTGEVVLSTLGAVIAREVRAITDRQRPWRLDGRALESRDVFVLTRTAREGRAIGQALRVAGVAHAFYKEEGLFQSEEANDVRILLAAIDDPDNRACRLRAWLTPFFGLPLEDIEHARDLPNSHPLVERLLSWKALADSRDFDGLFEGILTESGVIRREIFFSDGERSLTNYAHLLELLNDRARSGHKTLTDLVSELTGLRARTRLPLDLEGNVQRLESERSAVQIMTIHKAKGLEAAVVFLAGGLGQGSGDDVRVYHEAGRRTAWVGPLSPKAATLVKEGEREEDQRLMYVALTRAMGRLYLPCGDAGSARRRRGAYEIVNRRIVALVSAGEETVTVDDVDAADSCASSEPPDEPKRSPSPREPVDEDESRWVPPSGLLHEEPRGPHYDALRVRSAAGVVTSYTRMKATRPRARSAWVDAGTTTRDDDIEIANAPRSSLRGARVSGIFLHELLERVPAASFGASSLEAWRKRDDVSSLVTEAMVVHRIESPQRSHAEELVWTAYTTGVDLPGGERLASFSSATRIAREMQFIFPTFEPSNSAKTSDRRFVRGSLDLVFVHDHRTYFVDWKSDTLSSYASDFVAGHVADQYEEQLRLYALAVVKLLGVTDERQYASRFGGLCYCFLRGFSALGEGVWFSRPTWNEITQWNDDLIWQRSWASRESRNRRKPQNELPTP